MDRNQNHFRKKTTKIAGKRSTESSPSKKWESGDASRTLSQPSATWISQEFPQVVLVCLHLLALHGKQVFNPDKENSGKNNGNFLSGSRSGGCSWQWRLLGGFYRGKKIVLSLVHKSLQERTCLWIYLYVCSTQSSSPCPWLQESCPCFDRHSCGWAVVCPCFHISHAGNSMTLTTGESFAWDLSKSAQQAKDSAGGSNFFALNCRVYPCSYILLFSSLDG